MLEKQLEDLDFLEELLHICHMVEMDGVNSRKLSTTDEGMVNSNSPKHSWSYPYSDVGNMSFASLCQDFQVNFPGYNADNYDRSVSLTNMLNGSIEEQLHNNIKQYSQKTNPRLRGNLNKTGKHEKAHKLMKYILDIMTHLAYYREPVDPRLAVFVEARFDGYIPREGSTTASELWPGCEVKYTECGHIFAALYKQDVFRKTIVETLNKIP